MSRTIDALVVPLIAAIVTAIIGGRPDLTVRPPSHEVRHYTVTIRDFAFDPDTLRIAVGDSVTWINPDVAPHTVTSSHEKGWDSGPLVEGSASSWVASIRGRIDYACRFHPAMTAVVYVD